MKGCAETQGYRRAWGGLMSYCKKKTNGFPLLLTERPVRLFRSSSEISSTACPSILWMLFSLFPLAYSIFFSLTASASHLTVPSGMTFIIPCCISCPSLLGWRPDNTFSLPWKSIQNSFGHSKSWDAWQSHWAYWSQHRSPAGWEMGLAINDMFESVYLRGWGNYFGNGPASLQAHIAIPDSLTRSAAVWRHEECRTTFSS